MNRTVRWEYFHARAPAPTVSSGGYVWSAPRVHGEQARQAAVRSLGLEGAGEAHRAARVPRQTDEGSPAGLFLVWTFFGAFQ